MNQNALNQNNLFLTVEYHSTYHYAGREEICLVKLELDLDFMENQLLW